MCDCITFRTNVYLWLMKAGMTANEMLVYCMVCDYVRNNQIPRFTYKQIAELLGSEDKAEAPYIARKAVKGLVEKGFIEIHYHGGKGSANHYALLKTPYDIFLQIDKENPNYFSDAQRTVHIQELKLNGMGYGKPAENREQPTPEVETVTTVDAHNWENRDEEIRKQARQLWDNRYKECVGKAVFKLSQVRDALRGQEADDCRDKRPDKYWNMGKTDLECINWMIRSGLRVEADTGTEIEYYGDLQAISHTDNYFKNIKTVEVEKNGKTFEQFELTE